MNLPGFFLWLTERSFNLAVSLFKPPDTRSTCNNGAIVVTELVLFSHLLKFHVFYFCGSIISVWNHAIGMCIGFYLCVWICRSFLSNIMTARNLGLVGLVCGQSQLHICRACPAQTGMFWRKDCGDTWNLNYMLQFLTQSLQKYFTHTVGTEYKDPLNNIKNWRCVVVHWPVSAEYFIKSFPLLFFHSCIWDRMSLTATSCLITLTKGEGKSESYTVYSDIK